MNAQADAGTPAQLKYLDPISSPCEGIGELKYRP